MQKHIAKETQETNHGAGFSQIDDFLEEYEDFPNPSDDDVYIAPTVASSNPPDDDIYIAPTVASPVRNPIESPTRLSAGPSAGSAFDRPMTIVSFDSSEDVNSDVSGESDVDIALPNVETMLSQTATANLKPASTAPAALPAQRLSQIPHSTAGPTGRTRKKSKHQLQMESQQRRDTEKKQTAKAAREAATARKKAKLNARRKQDVSQLANQFDLLSSSPPQP